MPDANTFPRKTPGAGRVSAGRREGARRRSRLIGQPAGRCALLSRDVGSPGGLSRGTTVGRKDSQARSALVSTTSDFGGRPPSICPGGGRNGEEARGARPSPRPQKAGPWQPRRRALRQTALAETATTYQRSHAISRCRPHVLGAGGAAVASLRAPGHFARIMPRRLQLGVRVPRMDRRGGPSPPTGCDRVDGRESASLEQQWQASSRRVATRDAPPFRPFGRGRWPPYPGLA